ncbi:putative C6 transcription factor [Talaromyces proteolyticus]|uniref:C6 transcription factor n=1 Tax=Talaromyces proteolyticus TaxID=1131652 RepID=A0AAD4KIV9_9EURO|nr:putative C6 transcription factor [Talaromyces proteolyticus]KAH8692227.1 putative C6 transcription factor [Talaromyces proteolyticus]
MEDEQRPERASSIPSTQPGNPEWAQNLSDSSSTLVGDSRLRVPDKHPSSRVGGAKVAIPRAPVFSEQSSGNKRVGHACEPCREQKTKCSGDRPVCQRCQDLGLSCLYGDRKRERTAKQLRDYAKQIQEYEQLFNNLHPKLDQQDVQLIQDTLSRVGALAEFDGTDDFALTRPGPSDSDYSSNPARPFLTDFLSGADYTEEDFNRNERSIALGFVGRHSETSWLYNLKREIESNNVDAEQTEQTPPEEDLQDRNSIASVSYFLDDADIPIIEDLDPLERPSRVVANRLVLTFFNTVHGTFPIIGKETFLSQVNSFYSAPFARPGRRWLAILNLVFAIASRNYHHQIQPSSLDVGEETLQYFSRAWRLGMKDSSLLGHPDLQQAQVEGLTAFLLLSLGHANRAWRICGLAIRSATGMGLNLRSESNYVTLASKESRYKVWWSLYTLEALLGNMTGRPFGVERDFCTTPLPVPFEEEGFNDAQVAQIMADNRMRNSLLGHVVTKPTGDTSPALTSQSIRTARDILRPNYALFFVCYIDLTRLMRQVVETLYAPEIVQNSPTDPEIVITDLNIKADAWLSRLPGAFRFIDDPSVASRDNYRLRLGLQFYSTKILICKPCLHRIDQFSCNDDSFYERTAISCVQAACRMLDLFPAVYNATWFSQVAPWWSALHYLVQATTVLLIELSIDSGPKPEEFRQALAKATSWLREMALRDSASQRACAVCGLLLEQLASVAGEEED